MLGDCIKRQLRLVAPADQHPQRALALSAIGRGLREPLLQESNRPPELISRSIFLRSILPLGQGLVDEIGFHAPGQERPADATAPPLVQPAAVLREQPGVAGVIEISRLGQLLNRGVHSRTVNVAADQIVPQLADRPFAPAQIAIGKLERLLAHAACSSTTPAGCQSSSRPAAGAGGAAISVPSARPSIGFTRSRPIPSSA